jgi:transposase
LVYRAPRTVPEFDRARFWRCAPLRSRVGYRRPTVTSAAPLQFLILLVASWIGRRQGEAIEYLRAENRVLRARLGPKRIRFTDAERRLLAEKGKPLGRKLLAEMASLATPDTILRWYREQVATKYDGSRTRGGPGRPASRCDKVQQLLTMARENPSWGYTRLRGALENLGFDLGRSTIQRILAEHGIEPAPLRGRTMPWKTFLKAHWGAIAAADFFSVEVLTRGASYATSCCSSSTSRHDAFTSPASPARPTALGWRRSPATSPTPQRAR